MYHAYPKDFPHVNVISGRIQDKVIPNRCNV